MASSRLNRCCGIGRMMLAGLFGAAWLVAPAGARAQLDPAGQGRTGRLNPSGQPPVAQSQAAQARKAVQDAMVQVRTAEQQFTQCRARVEAQFKTRPDWVAAQKAVEKAKADLEAAKTAAIRALNANPEYKSAKAAKDAADKKQRELIEINASPAQMDQVGQEITTNAYKIREMEAGAIAAAPGYANAKMRLDEATAAFQRFQAEVDAAAKSDPDCQNAESQVLQAREQVKNAQDSLAQVIRSESEARAAAAKARADELRNKNRK